MNLKKLAESFNYLKEYTGPPPSEIKVTSNQEEELMDIMLKYIKDPDDAQEVIDNYLGREPDSGFKAFDIRALGNVSGDFEGEVKAWAKKHIGLNEAVIKLTPDQDEELLNIIKTYVKDPDEANNKIQDYIDGDVNQPDIQDGDFIDEFEAWKKKHNIKEGTCGYSVDGKPADTPAGPDLIKIREAIKKELRNLKK